VRALHGALSAAAEVAPAKTPMPVLRNALLVADEVGTFNVTATDALLRVRWTIPATVDVPGRALVPIWSRAQWLDALADLDCPVDLELDDEWLHWRCGPFRARTPLWDPDDFPDVTTPDLAAPEVVLDLTTWASVAGSLLAQADGKDAEVRVDSNGDRVRLSHTGPGHATVAVLRNHGTPESNTPGWRLPARALSALHVADEDRRRGGEPAHIAASTGGRSIVLWRDGVEVTAQLAPGRSPPAADSVVAAWSRASPGPAWRSSATRCTASWAPVPCSTPATSWSISLGRACSKCSQNARAARPGQKSPSSRAQPGV
jgi:hypothetical protein